MLCHISQRHRIQIRLNVIQHKKMIRCLSYIVRQRRLHRRKAVPGNQTDQHGHHSYHYLIGACVMKKMFLIKLYHNFLNIHGFCGIRMKYQIVDVLRIIKPFRKEFADDIILLHKRRKHLIKG